MKTKIGKLLRGGLLCVATVSLAASCTTDEITYKTGQKPDKETLENVYGTLRSSKSLRDRVPVNLDEGDHALSDNVYYRLSQPSAQPVSVTVVPDLSLVDVYNEANKTALKPLPLANVDIANGGKLSVAAGERMSGKLDVTIKADGLEPGIYLMPVTVSQTEGDGKNQVIYYGVKIREFDENKIQIGDDVNPLQLDTEWTTVFYVNTSEIQAHYADYVAWEKQDLTTFESVYQASLGNIVNLRIAQVGYAPDSKRALFSPTSDLCYTVEHADKYIRQMQDKGRKVCVCIEGGGAGVGFCNMTDAQIADFTEQVKAFVTLYDLDGVNLWDRGSGYGKEGMPAVNTTSYPKLIKALREAMPEKLVTVVDYEEPTESFHDTAQTGGIAVGDYIDYAWHGYVSDSEPIVFSNPYNPWTGYTQNVTRQPFAGLPEAKYGNVNIPFYSEKSDIFMDMDMDMWSMNAIMWNLERTSNIIVFNDLVLPQVNFAELGCISMIQNFYMYLAYDENFEAPYSYNVMERIYMSYHGSGYNTFAKDW